MRIAVTTAFGYWGAFHPRDLFEPGGARMLGGGETAMLQLARALAQAGHRVDLFYDAEEFGDWYGINFLPKYLKMDLLVNIPYDLLISWEDVGATEISHLAKKVIYAAQCNTLDIGVRDVGIDAYQAVSVWHANELYRTDPRIDPGKFWQIPNGVDHARYADPAPERELYRVHHSSSPDRGLHHLLEIWPRIRRALPQATLHTYYDTDGWFRTVDSVRAMGGGELNTSERADRVRAGFELVKDLGHVHHGAVGQWELAREQQKASLMVYPCDPVRPTEGFSNSVLEALAAGTPAVITDADAFPELWEAATAMLPLPFDPDVWVDAIIEKLRRGHDDAFQAESEQGKLFSLPYAWDLIGREYVRRIEELCQ